MMREYHWTFEQFLFEEPSRTNALRAAACEHAGLYGRDTYLSREIRAHIDEIMSGQVEF